MPEIALVGRPNVGKSLLFNQLAQKALSLVHDRPGVTRDRIVADCLWDDRALTLVDTGGMGLEDDSRLADAVRREAEIGVVSADALVFVVDGREGLTPLDAEIAGLLRKSRKPIILAVNKLDDPKQNHDDIEFSKLGFAKICPVSAAHRRGLDALKQAVLAAVRDCPDQAASASREEVTRIAIVGQPNVGKSSLINAILGDSRTIVSEIAGTTRDSVEIPYTRQTPEGVLHYSLVDTAGMRQRRRIEDPLEREMTARTAHAINRADICVLLMGANTGVTMQDKKIAGLIQKAHKPCLLAVNKWDIAKGQQAVPQDRPGGKELSFRKQYEEAVRAHLFFLSYAPMVFTSATEARGIDELFTALDRVSYNLRAPISTGEINRVLLSAYQQQPAPIRKGRRFKILYATPEKTAGRWPSKTLIAFCNDRSLLNPSWLTFLESRLRDKFPLAGCPLRWIWREREKNPAQAGRPQHSPGSRSQNLDSKAGAKGKKERTPPRGKSASKAGAQKKTAPKKKAGSSKRRG